MAPRVGFGEHSHLGSHAGGIEGKVSVGEPVLHSGEQHRIQSATGCRCVQDLQELRFLAGDVSDGEGNPGQPCGFEQCCIEHRVEAVFPGRVGLHGYAGDGHETITPRQQQHVRKTTTQRSGFCSGAIV